MHFIKVLEAAKNTVKMGAFSETYEEATCLKKNTLVILISFKLKFIIIGF